MTTRMEDDDLDVSLLERYCSEAVSLEEATRIDDWFRRHPDQRVWYEGLKAGLRKGEFPDLSSERSRAAKAAIIRAALERRPGNGAVLWSVQPHPKRPAYRPVFGKQRLPLVPVGGGGLPGLASRGSRWLIAATLVLGCVIGGTLWTRHNHQRLSSSMLAYTTGNGERATITLPDGGTVALNVASRLEVPLDYMSGHRTVRLVGEGLFTISHHDGAPFTVLAGTTAARVLGTDFVVRRYDADTATMVAVREGKVAVDGMVVTRAHLIEVGDAGILNYRPTDLSPFTFATGVLTLDSVPLSRAVPELDRWYDVDVRLGSPALARRQLTGAFSAGTIDDLADMLAYTLGVRAIRNKKILTLYPRE